MRSQHTATTAHRALPVCVWPALVMPWGTARSNTASAESSRCGGACIGCCGRAGQVVCGGCGFVDLWRFSSEEEAPLANHCAKSLASLCVASPGHATGHTARSNAAPAVCSRCGEARTGCCGRAGQVVCGGCGFVGYWRRFSDEEAPLGNYCAQSLASVRVASPGYFMGRCKVKCSFCSVQQVSWSLHWVLLQGWLGSYLFAGVTVLPIRGVLQRRGQHSASKVHRALSVCEWPVMGMTWATARSNAASAVRSRCGGLCTVCHGRAGQVACCRG